MRYKVKLKGYAKHMVVEADSDFDAIRGFVAKEIESVEEFVCTCKAPCQTCRCVGLPVGVRGQDGVQMMKEWGC